MQRMPTSPREKLLIRVLAPILGLLVLVVAARFVMGRGDGPASSAQPVSVQGNATSDPEPRTSLPEVPPLPFTGRDPFVPLVAATPEAVAPPSPGSTSAVPSPQPSATPTPTPSPTPSPQPAPSSAAVGGHTVSLLDVFSAEGTDEAVVLLDTTVYTVKAGDQFGDFSVESIAPPCVTFGWQGQTFDLCAQ